MVKSVLNAFDDIQSILLERGEMHRMSHISKDILQMLIHFLQPFKQATEELSGSKYCTINLVALWKTTLLTHCQFSQDDPVPLRIMKHRCMGLISERIVLGHHEKLGVLLWPKFKQLRMFTPEEREEIYESTCRELASLPKRATTTEVNAQQQQEEDKEMARSVPPPGAVPIFSQWADIEDAELDTGLDELEQYLQRKPTMENDRDILSFWKHNQNLFPSMARLARKILCVPASSVSCELAFSISGRTLENRRTCLSTASVNVNMKMKAALHL
ncbi:E3 SUMO-protein ligase ZBED1-like [Onychostoma macrolepis]|uniref:E3 SUMO-protein ligase ZBED1-like n=1 Tax=Onychostoma macrolepis TaxID=369639 RepID=UPI00272A20A7|nr:E3 SUMO-protein ligase ZBED1-like [Onychostoma macrolepis]